MHVVFAFFVKHKTMSKFTAKYIQENWDMFSLDSLVAWGRQVSMETDQYPNPLVDIW